MNNKERKNIQKELGQKNIEHYFKLLENRFEPEYNKFYIKEICKLSEGFTIRLTREQKLKFCKKCFTYMNTKTQEIRLNSMLGAKEYICKNCGNVKRFKYK